ncbi:hypothetical protein CALVIDRAFT_599466 [Calocera viscosa TUFC12733]|uniref:Uncharacterized protein n=1 Tax=Calocera viscosa (strain TUFC12733) TaxID=1330018 RepID=A0A167KTV5_CALVF|nr:hypothetical protein CALVIDRAFT_599466 [Calocera viscosa TUFC12733]
MSQPSRSAGYHPQDARISSHGALRRSQAFLAATMPTSHLEDPLYTIAENAKEAAAQLQAKVAAIRARYNEEELRRKYRVNEAFDGFSRTVPSASVTHPLLATPKYVAAQSVLDMFGTAAVLTRTGREQSQESESLSAAVRARSSQQPVSSSGDADQEVDVEMVEVDPEEDEGYENSEDGSIVAYNDDGHTYDIFGGAVMEDEDTYEEEEEEREYIVQQEEDEETYEEEEEEREYIVQQEEDEDMEGDDGDEDTAALLPSTSQHPQLADHDIFEEMEEMDVIHEEAANSAYILPEALNDVQGPDHLDEQLYTHIDPAVFGSFPINSAPLSIAPETGPSWLSEFINSAPLDEIPGQFMGHEAGLYPTQQPYATVPEDSITLPFADPLIEPAADPFTSPNMFGGLEAFVNLSPVVESQSQFLSTLSLPTNPLDVLAAAASWNVVAEERAESVDANEQRSTMPTEEASSIVSGPAFDVSRSEGREPELIVEVDALAPADMLASEGPLPTTVDSFSLLPPPRVNETPANHVPMSYGSPGPSPAEGLPVSSSQGETVTEMGISASMLQESGGDKIEMQSTEQYLTTSSRDTAYEAASRIEDMSASFLPESVPELSSDAPQELYPSHHLSSPEAVELTSSSLDTTSPESPNVAVGNSNDALEQRMNLDQSSDSADAISARSSTSEMAASGRPLVSCTQQSSTTVVDANDTTVATSVDPISLDVKLDVPEDTAVDNSTAAGIEDETIVEAMLLEGPIPDDSMVPGIEKETITELMRSATPQIVHREKSLDEDREQEDVEEVNDTLFAIQLDNEEVDQRDSPENISADAQTVLQIPALQVPVATSEQPPAADSEGDDRDDISVVSRMIPAIHSREQTPVPTDFLRVLDSRATTPLSSAPSDLFSGDYDLDEFHPELEQRDVPERNPLEGLALPKRAGLHSLERSAPPEQPPVSRGQGQQIGLMPEAAEVQAGVTAVANGSPLSESGLDTEPVVEDGPEPISPRRAELNTFIPDAGIEILQSRASTEDGLVNHRIIPIKSKPTIDERDSITSEDQIGLLSPGAASQPRIEKIEGDKPASAPGESSDEQSWTADLLHISVDGDVKPKYSVEDTDTARLPPVLPPSPHTPSMAAVETKEEDVLSDSFEFVPHHHGSASPSVEERNTPRRRQSSAIVEHLPLTRARCRWEKVLVKLDDQPSRTFLVTICNINEARKVDGVTRQGPARRAEFLLSLPDIPPLIAEAMPDVLEKLQKYINTSPLGAAHWLPVSPEEVEAASAESLNPETMRKALKRARPDEDDSGDSFEPIQKKSRTPTPTQTPEVIGKGVSSEPRRTRSQPKSASIAKGKSHRKSLSFDSRVTPTRELPDPSIGSSPSSGSATVHSTPSAVRYPLRNRTKEEHSEQEQQLEPAAEGSAKRGSSKRKQREDEEPTAERAVESTERYPNRRPKRRRT